MKTVFKVGMKVYDQVNFPDKEGKVEEIYISDEEEYPIVSFGERERVCYSPDGSLLDRITKTLSTKPYKVVFDGFEQKAPAPTFEKAWEETERVYEPKSEYDKEEYKGYPSQELADASEALRKLLFLRDYYNEGWQPDFSKETKNTKYCISKDASGRFMKYDYYNYDFNNVLIFKSEQIRSKFWDEQLELMKIAKPLL